MKFTYTNVKRELSKRGLSVRKDSGGDIRVAFRKANNEASAYYTDNAQDAYFTGLRMVGAIHSGTASKNPRKRKPRYTRTKRKPVKRKYNRYTRKVTRVRRNPGFIICARERKGSKRWYWDGIKFVQQKQFAWPFNSVSQAQYTARKIVKRLPYRISSISVERG